MGRNISGDRSLGRASRLLVRSAAAGLVACLLASSVQAAPADTTSEALLAATLHARDLTRVAPGGWWDDEPEFNGHMEPDAPAGLQDFVVAHVFGRPDARPSEIRTALSSFVDTRAAEDDFKARLASDLKLFGHLAQGPRVGDASRYLSRPAGDGGPATLSLRVRQGRFAVRIDATGEAATMGVSGLARLGQVEIGRVAELESGALTAPPLPSAASLLPPPDADFGPVMGAASAAPRVWVWRWSPKAQEYVVSSKLRHLMIAGMGDDPGAFERYGLAGHASDIVEVTLMPFRTRAAAAAYEAVDLASEPTSVPKANGVTVVPPAPGRDAYEALLRRDRYVAAITCSAPYARTGPECEDAVRKMAERLLAKLAT